MTTPPRKCPICGIDMEPCDYSPLYGYSWVHPKTENDCKYKDETLLFGGHKDINTGKEKVKMTNPMELILAERKKALEGRKLPENRHPADWLVILAEEFGEVAREVCNINFDMSGANANTNRAIQRYKTELAQLAGVCISMLDDIDSWALSNGYES